MVAKALPGDSEKYLGTVLALATGNPLFAGIGALADPEAGFGEIAQAAFLANASPGLKFGKFDMTAGNKLLGDGKFMSALQGGGKTGAGSFAEFLLGKKGTPVQGKKIGFETPKSIAGATDGIFGSGGSFIPTKIVDGEEKVDAAKLLARLGGASAITGAALSPFGLFDTPKTKDEFDGKFPGSDYVAQSLNLTPGQLLDLQLGGGIAGPYYNMQGNLVQNAAQGGFMQEPTNGLKEIENVMMMAQGGTSEFPRKTGEISGPGTGTSDSIPAMLSDGEFVMTAKAVKGAGGGDRMEGARKMYEMMDQLEARG